MRRQESGKCDCFRRLEVLVLPMVHQWFKFATCLAITMSIAATTQSQDTKSLAVKNGGMELSQEGGAPGNWRCGKKSGIQYRLDSSNPYKGSTSLLIDTTALTSDSADMVASGYQRVDVKAWRGKRIKFSAAARASDLKGPARLQLTAREERLGEGLLARMARKSIIIDDMSNRPIRSTDWERYDIVLDVDEEANFVVIGWKLVGMGRAWLDDITVVEVGSDMPLTADPPAEIQTPQETIPPIIVKAMQDSHLAPQQAFFNHWLWLALLALLLFSISSCGTGASDKSPELFGQDGVGLAPRKSGLVKKFAFRFTVAYWLLFVFNSPFLGELGRVATWVEPYYSAVVDVPIYWLARNMLGLEGELVPPFGSGDTTYSYLQVLVRFMAALVIGVLWSAVDWRKTDYVIARDLFNSYMRYTLAAALLVYALIKISWDGNQFPTLQSWQYDDKLGESSPMGIVWKFMRASRPYTVFAGLGELIAAALLIFRRTSILGALTAVGVMTNVVMLNFCYDVPVKILSAHMLVMGVILLLGEMGALKGLLFFKSQSPRKLSPPYIGRKSKWGYFLVKAAIIVVGFVMPCWTHVSQQAEYFAKQAELPDWLGEYELQDFKVDGTSVDPKAFKTAWKSARFDSAENSGASIKEDSPLVMSVVVRGSPAVSSFRLSDSNSLILEPSEFPTMLQGECSYSVGDDQTIVLDGMALAGKVEATLKKTSSKSKNFLVYERGFRWINEAPFNR